MSTAWSSRSAARSSPRADGEEGLRTPNRPEHAGWSGQAVWQERLGGLRNRVRQELVSRQLSSHLPRRAAGLRALDIGCGQGTQLLWLARRGYGVTGVDISTELLDRARRALELEPDQVRTAVRLCVGDVQDLGVVADAPFDVVVCHGVLMYVPSLSEGVSRVAGTLKPGGLVSLLTRNRASIAMRAGMGGDWLGALEGFEARRYDNRVGVKGVRADEPREVVEALGRCGVELEAWYGVRLFTDHWGDVAPPADFERLLEAEEEAGRRDPYRQLCSLTHVVGRRSP
jgi:SAM-dependent methyltransferase